VYIPNSSWIFHSVFPDIVVAPQGVLVPVPAVAHLCCGCQIKTAGYIKNAQNGQNAPQGNKLQPLVSASFGHGTPP
jgi:hypothetical protein